MGNVNFYTKTKRQKWIFIFFHFYGLQILFMKKPIFFKNASSIYFLVLIEMSVCVSCEESEAPRMILRLSFSVFMALMLIFI